MRIFLVVVFVLLISETITKHKRHRHTKKGKPSTRKLDEIKEMSEKSRPYYIGAFDPGAFDKKLIPY